MGRVQGDGAMEPKLITLINAFQQTLCTLKSKTYQESLPSQPFVYLSAR